MAFDFDNVIAIQNSADVNFFGVGQTIHNDDVSFFNKMFSRLALVSNVLCDRELLELRQENKRQRREIDALKVELFMDDHNINKLAMAVSLMCLHYRALLNVRHDDQTEWSLWIEPMLSEFGLCAQIDDEYLDDRSDLDVHITRTSYCIITSYGTKLWKAKSVDDPEMQKLKAFLRHCEMHSPA